MGLNFPIMYYKSNIFKVPLLSLLSFKRFSFEFHFDLDWTNWKKNTDIIQFSIKVSHHNVLIVLEICFT